MITPRNIALTLLIGILRNIPAASVIIMTIQVSLRANLKNTVLHRSEIEITQMEAIQLDILNPSMLPNLEEISLITISTFKTKFW